MKTNKYKIKAIDKSGNTLNMEMYANSADEIYDILFIRELEPLSVKKSFEISIFSSNATLSDYEMIFLFRQLLSLVLSGISIGEGVNILSNRIAEKKFRAIFRNIASSLASGKTLANAFLESGYRFPPIVLSFINQGENSGDMAEAFKRIISYWEKRRNIKNRLIDAFIYPSILMIIITVIVFFLTMFVIPEFTTIYSDFSSKLPLATRITLCISNFVRENILIIFGIFIALFSGIVFSFKGKYPMIFSFIINLPFIRTFFRYYTVSYISMALGSLLGSGMEIDDSLEVIQRGNLENKVKEVRRLLRSGNSLSFSLTKLGIFSDVNIEMISVGENSGRLSEVFMNISEFYDSELDIFIRRSLAMLEPALIILLGGMVGFIVFSMFLPIIQLASLIK